MRATLSCRELAEASVGGPLGRMLARLGAAIDGTVAFDPERESHSDPEPLPQFTQQGIESVGLVGRQSPA